MLRKGKILGFDRDGDYTEELKAFEALVRAVAYASKPEKYFSEIIRIWLQFYPYPDMIEACQELKQESGTMETVIQVQVRNVYGKPVVYPANEAAELIAAIAGTKTLSTATLAYARRLGFDIKQVEAYPLAEVA
jgi:hypothetical protein